MEKEFNYKGTGEHSVRQLEYGIEKLLQKYNDLRAENERKSEAINSALRIKDLWCGEWTLDPNDQHKTEAIALRRMLETLENTNNKN